MSLQFVAWLSSAPEVPAAGLSNKSPKAPEDKQWTCYQETCRLLTHQEQKQEDLKQTQLDSPRHALKLNRLTGGQFPHHVRKHLHAPSRFIARIELLRDHRASYLC